MLTCYEIEKKWKFKYRYHQKKNGFICVQFDFDFFKYCLCAVSSKLIEIRYSKTDEPSAGQIEIAEFYFSSGTSESKIVPTSSILKCP